MAQFSTEEQSHIHSRQTLDILYGYDSFLDSLSVITDMGCGSGLDINWWATLMTRDDPPEPRNYYCMAIDKNPKLFNNDIASLPNVRFLEGDFETKLLSRQSDLIWCHDSFQYAINPLNTLKTWNRNMNENGMLVLILKQTVGYEYNRYVGRTHNFQYYNHDLGNLLYMLAVNGFDCNDAYAYKDTQNNYLHLAVYKSDIQPMDPTTTTLADLADSGLLHTSVVNSINKYNHLRHEDILYPWLDKDFYRAK